MLFRSISNNLILGNTNSIYLYSYSTVTQDLYFANNTVQGTTNDFGVDLETNNGGYNINFTNNDFNAINNDTAYIYYTSTSPSNSNLTINNNRFNGSATGNGLKIENHSNSNLIGEVTNNTFIGNSDQKGLYILQDSTTPNSICLNIVGNTASGNNTNYTLTNDGADGTFQITPCNAASVNTGGLLIHTTNVTLVESCSSGIECP